MSESSFCLQFFIYSFSATRSFALRARGFRPVSSPEGLIAPPARIRTTGFRPQVQTGALGGQMQGCCSR